MDYQNGKIYSIHNTEDDLVYVGSTASTLVKRFSIHKKDRTQDRRMNSPLYKHMNAIGFDKFYIKLVEEFPCENRTELCAREGVWIREMGTLNKQVAGRTLKEWYNDNRDARLEYQKKYVHDNRDKIRDKQNEKFECPCGGKYKYMHKSQHFKSKKHMKHMENQTDNA
jgi:hypothetical protein